MVTAIVLAGGRSMRMGTPKALLSFDEEPLIVHIVRRLEPLFGEIIVVAAPGQELPSMPVTLVRDDVAYQGPVGGICYGLRAASTDLAFVTSCDSPLLQPRLVSYLLSVSAGWDATVTRWEGRLQPLVGCYRRTIVPLLAAQLETGELRLSAVLERVPTRTVEEDEIRAVDRDGASFVNLNTPEDYADALRRWRPAR
jgi:molybdenum cofactor guanylyltransferase